MKNINQLAAAATIALTFACSPAGAVDTGQSAPDFTLKSIDGETVSLADFKGKYVVLEWVNHGCPFVVKHYDSGNMPALQKEYTGKDVVWLSICSSAEGKQGHYTPGEWQKLNAEKKGAASAVLLDGDGTVGKEYGAKTTPHMYIVGKDGTLIYQGAIDDKPSTDAEDIPGSKNYVKAALDEALAGKPVSTPTTKSYGCGVKYP
jgi:alkyl hydroperoxide reductase subunit AhpC